jgi:hypothetical protein
MAGNWHFICPLNSKIRFYAGLSRINVEPLPPSNVLVGNSSAYRLWTFGSVYVVGKQISQEHDTQKVKLLPVNGS